ncbi:Lar family restriction alleviation protein [Desulfovibrio sp. OttesenSCG-928-G15]|nr:Lar family restriction alleviation protein [Desulfovibrio sp. OttesenSCG-928-G15]
MNNPELMPCPFCGGKASVGTTTYDPDYAAEEGWTQNVFYFVNCIRCGGKYQGVVGSSTPESAIAAWNRRAQGWQPMDTAPKDGTFILTYSMQSICLVQAARWDKMGTWRNVYDMMLDPDAWKPLPAAPEPAE